VRVPFTVEVKDVAATTIARAKSAVSSAKADDWSTAFRAANYAKQNKAEKDATAWYEHALKANDEAIKTKANFANLSGRANILLALGRRDEAIAAADKAIETGKAEKANTGNFEKRFADVKAGKI
jgi:tetratricopeptide (TPR) repeat protein